MSSPQQTPTSSDLPRILNPLDTSYNARLCPNLTQFHLPSCGSYGGCWTYGVWATLSLLTMGQLVILWLRFWYGRAGEGFEFVVSTI